MIASHRRQRDVRVATPSFAALLRRLVASISDEKPKLKPTSAVVQFLRASRMLFFRREYREFLRLRHEDTGSTDVALEFLSCLRYRHYLSKRLSLRQRVAGLLHHARYEEQRCQHGFRDAVVDGSGIELWQQVVDGTAYSIRLVAAQDNAVEGQLSVVLFVEAQRICVMSFSYVGADAFGLPSEPILFIARNQSDAGSADKTLFIRAFKQNMPSYFCLAAISGIALAHGMKRLAAVKARAHVSFDSRHARSFDHSYGSFWDAFHASDVDDHVALLPLPLQLHPIDAVSSKHRNRARTRRRHWQDIQHSAWKAMRTVPRTEAPGGHPQPDRARVALATSMNASGHRGAAQHVNADAASSADARCTDTR